MTKRGVALIVTFMVVVVLTILGSATISRSVSERFITQRYVELTRAFWLAEAGVNHALGELRNDYNVISGNCKWETNLGSGRYCVDLSDKDINGRRTVTAHGYIPSTIPARAERKIKVLVESTPSNPSLLEYAIASSGDLKITGNVKLMPSGSSHAKSTLTFEQVFGMTKDQVKAIAVSAQAAGTGHVYTNPDINQQPVNGITWVDLTGSNKYKISSDWSGSGLLIVNGNGNDVALDISGSWQFTGVIWVIGKVSISGTPVITGAIFAESSFTVESTLTGNTKIIFNSTTVSSTFDLLSPTGLKAWREL